MAESQETETQGTRGTMKKAGTDAATPTNDAPPQETETQGTYGTMKKVGTDASSPTNNDAAPPQEAERPVYSVFSHRIKIFVICMTVFGTIFSPFSSFIYLPALTPIANDYHRSLSDINFTVTVYQIMQALAPLFFGDLSDQIGRRPVYVLTFAIYLAANIGLALQNSYAALMVLRALQSTGSSATVAIGNAVIADLTTASERGGYVTAVQSSIMFAPALAPVLGGILTQYLGWRSTFWFLAIAAGVFVVIYIPFVPEVRWKKAARRIAVGVARLTEIISLHRRREK